MGTSQEKKTNELEKLLDRAFPDMPAAEPDPQLELEFPADKKPPQREKKARA